METTKNKKSGLAAIFLLCPIRHIVLLLSAALILAHLAARQNIELMERAAESFIRPAHRTMALLAARVPFSLAEALIAAAVLWVLAYLILSFARLIKSAERWASLYRLVVSLLTAAALYYALFCVFWGALFYAPDFTRRSGLRDDAVSTDALRAVTEHFALLANEYSFRVDRDENGFCATDRAQVLERSAHIYDNVEKNFPQLTGPDVPVKGIAFSRIMSYIDFTGFFFPLTGEANVNMDFPPSLFASTVAHEISHQRGVAKEQEANFVAVLASLESGDADYIYSAALLAYTHLGNALHGVDYEAWKGIYAQLNDNVLRDFALNRAYWQQFETPVQTVSNTVYEGFLHSYDQYLGLKSYGACVDLLVNYYYPLTDE